MRRSSARDLAVNSRFSRQRGAVGEIATYSVTVSNNGTLAAADVRLRSSLGRRFELVRASTGRGTCSREPVVECALGTLATEETVRVTLVVRLRAGYYSQIRSTATTATPDPVTANDRDAAAIFACTHTGTPGRDRIVGTSGPDVICAGAGADEIHGLGGRDLVQAGRGNDRVFGGPGRDEIVGDDGDDVLHGGGGPDLVFADDGDDLVRGGPGGDHLQGGTGRDRLYGGTGDDDVDAYDAFADWVDGGPGHDAAVVTSRDRWTSIEHDTGVELSGRLPAFLQLARG